MLDWQALVEERLAGLALESEERAEVVAELVAHLEESCEALLRGGVDGDEAVRRTLLQVGSWKEVRKRIQRARRKENNVTDRVKQFWLPAFLTLLLSMVLLMLVQFIGPRPLVVGMHGWRLIAPVAVIYVPWLLLLLPIGAMGAYMAGRASGSRRAALLSIIFPVLPNLALFMIALPVSLILDEHVAHNVMFSALLIGLIAWVVLPGIALLAGGLPVQILRSRRSAFQQAAKP